MTPRQYERIVKQLLAKRGLAGLPGDPRLGYDADWVAARGDRDVERLRALAPRVAGDLEELRCAPVAGSRPRRSARARLAAGLAAMLFALVQLARRTGSDGLNASDDRNSRVGPGPAWKDHPCADSARPKV